jgi:uncharacterized membrane protein (DUF4010 family)
VRPSPAAPEQLAVSENPLELGAAAIFAVLFVLTSLLTNWVTSQFGMSGTYALAAIIGFADIDPFVLNLAQGGTSGISGDAAAAAILIATASNNVLKAGYATAFSGGRSTLPSAIALVALAVGGVAVAFYIGRG